MKTRLTLPEASVRCGLDASTLRQAAARGRLQAEKVGRNWITTDVALDAYLASRRKGNFTRGEARGRSLRYKRDEPAA